MTWELKKGTYTVEFDLAVGDHEKTYDTIARGLMRGWITVEWPEDEREEVEESNGSGSEAS